MTRDFGPMPRGDEAISRENAAMSRDIETSDSRHEAQQA